MTTPKDFSIVNRQNWEIWGTHTSMEKWMPMGIRNKANASQEFEFPDDADKVRFVWSGRVKQSKKSIEKTLRRELSEIKSLNGYKLNNRIQVVEADRKFKIVLDDGLVYVTFGKWEDQVNSLRNNAVVFGVGLGLAATGFGLLPAFLLAAGGSGGAGALKKDTRAFDAKQNYDEGFIAGLSGMVTGGFQMLQPFAKLGTSLVVQSINQVSTSVLGYSISTKLNGQELTLKGMGNAAAAGFVVLPASKAAGVVLDAGLDALRPSTITTIKGTATEVFLKAGTQGASGSAASQMMSNYLNGRLIEEDVGISAAQGALIAVAHAVPEAHAVWENSANYGIIRKFLADVRDLIFGKLEVAGETFKDKIDTLIKDACAPLSLEKAAKMKEILEALTESILGGVDPDSEISPSEQLEINIAKIEQDLNNLIQAKANAEEIRHDIIKKRYSKAKSIYERDIKKYIKEGYRCSFDGGKTWTASHSLSDCLKHIARGGKVMFREWEGRPRHKMRLYFRSEDLKRCNNKIANIDQAILTTEENLDSLKGSRPRTTGTTGTTTTGTTGTTTTDTTGTTKPSTTGTTTTDTTGTTTTGTTKPSTTGTTTTDTTGTTTTGTTKPSTTGTTTTGTTGTTTTGTTKPSTTGTTTTGTTGTTTTGTTKPSTTGTTTTGTTGTTTTGTTKPSTTGTTTTGTTGTTTTGTTGTTTIKTEAKTPMHPVLAPVYLNQVYNIYNYKVDSGYKYQSLGIKKAALPDVYTPGDSVLDPAEFDKDSSSGPGITTQRNALDTVRATVSAGGAAVLTGVTDAYDDGDDLYSVPEPKGNPHLNEGLRITPQRHAMSSTATAGLSTGSAVITNLDAYDDGDDLYAVPEPKGNSHLNASSSTEVVAPLADPTIDIIPTDPVVSTGGATSAGLKPTVSPIPMVEQENVHFAYKIKEKPVEGVSKSEKIRKVQVQLAIILNEIEYYEKQLLQRNFKLKNRLEITRKINELRGKLR